MTAEVQKPLVPAAGRAFVTLTGWTGSALFSATPVAGEQIEGPDTLTYPADGDPTGPDGTYTLHHIKLNGSTEAASYQIGTAAQVPQGTITLGTPTVDQTTISQPFTYSLADQTGFEYRVSSGGGAFSAWAATTSPVSLTGLTADTIHTIEVRAVNATGAGTAASTTVTTDVAPSSATTTVPFTAGSTYTTATLETGFDPYNFQGWPTGEPAAGWQITTLTADGYFDSMGNYFSDVEHIHDVWVTDLAGTVYHETVDNTSLKVALSGAITIGSATIGKTSASIPFTYSGTDATGYQYRLDTGGVWSAWANTTSPVDLGGLTAETPYTVEVRAYNATSESPADSLDFTTQATTDNTPDAFASQFKTNVARSTTIEFDPITVTGVDAGVDIPVTITNGEYAVDAGAGFGAYTSTSTNVRLNYKIKVRHTSGADYTSGLHDGTTTTSLDAGGTVGSFTSETIADTTKPVINLTGGNQTITQGDTWTEPGYTATDNADGDLTADVQTSGTVDTGTVGDYPLTYSVTDSSGNTGTAARTVTVVEAVQSDTTDPVITLVGGNQTLTEGDTWVEPGYSATDNVDGNLTADVVVSGALDTNTAGTYTRIYTVSDTAGNVGTASRTVTVEPAIEYPMDAAAPASRTFTAERLMKFASSEPLFIMQSGEILDFDFDLSTWLAEQGGSIAEGTHEITEVADGLEVLTSGKVTAADRIKVWLQANDVKDSESSLVQLKVSTTGYRTGVFQFRVVIINRMAA